MIDSALEEEQPVVTTTTLRQFAAIGVVVLGGSACWRAWAGHDVEWTVALGTLAFALGVLAVAAPERLRLFYMLLIAVTAPIGAVVSLVILAVLFYGVFTPVGFVRRLVSRDPLKVRMPTGSSHWTPRQPTKDLRDYTRQA